MDSNLLQMHLATVPVIDDILRDGARRALQAAVEREVDDYVERNRQHLDSAGHRLVVRNGHHPVRKIQSGNGPIEVHQPRVNDKRVDEQGQRIRFTSKILPPYLRKTKAIEELVPWLYLKGISSSDFPEALACLGHDGSGLSPTTIVRMKELWQGEYENFCRRELSGKRYVYLWADGIYFNIRLTDDRPCVLVLMGASVEVSAECRANWDRSINLGFGLPSFCADCFGPHPNHTECDPRTVDVVKSEPEQFLAPQSGIDQDGHH